MTVNKQAIAAKIAAYLHHEISVAQLVDWAESAIMDGEFVDTEMASPRSVVSRLGVADVRTFGLTWEDCEQMLKELGYSAKVEVAAA